jgi:hypothetical protein
MKPLFAFVMALVCLPAFADQFYLTAHLDCNQSKPGLAISFRGSWNGEGEAIIANLGTGDVSPLNLIAFSQDSSGKYLVAEKVDRKLCRIADQSYTVEFSPFTAPRFHPEGYCATRIGVKAVIKLQGIVVATAGVDACTEEGTVTKSMKLAPGKKPEYEQVDARQFYGT